MIPIFFRRYRKAPLATCVSFLATCNFIIAFVFLVGYILNWEGMREEMTLVTSLLAAAAFAALGAGCWKLAAWLATQKYKKLAAEAAKSIASAPATAPAPAGGFCPHCGAKVEAGDAFCTGCGAKL